MIGFTGLPYEGLEERAWGRPLIPSAREKNASNEMMLMMNSSTVIRVVRSQGRRGVSGDQVPAFI